MAENQQLYEGKTIIVSGAAGFVPSHLCEFYLKLGAKVIGIDNFITGSKSNIELLSKFENFEFYEMNIINELPDLKGRHLHYIFNLASPASPIDFDIIPIEIMQVNSFGTCRLLELARDKGARFLEASTSEVYGDPEVHPQVETYHGNVNPIGPRACYDESKRYSEAMCMSYREKFNIDTKIVRIFNTYGPRMRPNDGRVIPNFVNQAIEGKNLTIYGDGKQTRSFCYISDLIDGIHDVMSLGDHLPYNVGNPDEYTIKETAEFIIDALGSSSKTEFAKPLPKDDPKKRCPNVDRLNSLNGYRPQVSFKDGLKLTADYFKSLK